MTTQWIRTGVPKPSYLEQLASSCSLFHFEYPLIFFALHLARSSATVGPPLLRAFDGFVGLGLERAAFRVLELLRRFFAG